MTTLWTIHESPLGSLTLLGCPAGLTRLRFPGPTGRLDEANRRPAAFALAARQLDQ